MELTPGAKIYVGAVLLAGLGAAVQLAVSTGHRDGDWLPVLVFSVFGVASTKITISYGGTTPTRIRHQIGSSFAYPLLVLVDPGWGCLALAAMTLAELSWKRQRALTTAFNLAQFALGTWIAVRVRLLIWPDFERLVDLSASSISPAALTILLFAFVNQILTHGVASLVSRRSFFQWGWFTRTGVLNETLCLVSGLGMAVFWWVEPWLVVLGVVPIWSTILIIDMLNRRELALEERGHELQSLQGLGLELGAELDVTRLQETAVRVAGEALEASGSLLAILENESLAVKASHGIEPPVLPTIDRRGIDDLLTEPRQIRVVKNFAETRAEYPGLGFLEADGLLLAPLGSKDGRRGLLVLTHGALRRAFDDRDVRRMETLVRFINVALANAELVAQVHDVQSRLLHSEKMSALGMLVSGVAHELNNPLTSVLGYAELLTDREPDQRRRKMLGRITLETKRAARIVQNLLTFSRKHKPTKARIDLNSVLTDVLDFREYELRVRNVEVIKRLDPKLPPVLADPHQFQQVFLNLLTNAEQAIGERDRQGRIEVDTGVQDGAVVVRVADSGPGIPREHLEQVFLPFFSTKEVGRGTGLGLSICYGIVEEHGGTIHAESPEGGGAIFTVRMPAATAEATAAAVTDESARTESAPTRELRLLVVDDEAPIVQWIRDATRQLGWTVVGAGDGDRALELMRGAEFDALLVDLRMPGMDGPTLYERLLRDQPGTSGRVVFFTGDSDSVDSLDFLERAGRPVLLKPLDLDELLATISRVAEIRPTSRT